MLAELGMTTVVVAAVVGFFMLFALQLMCCFSFNSMLLRCVPLYTVFMALVLAFITSLFINGSMAGIGALLALVTGVAALGIVAGWLVWWLVRGRK